VRQPRLPHSPLVAHPQRQLAQVDVLREPAPVDRQLFAGSGLKAAVDGFGAAVSECGSPGDWRRRQKETPQVINESPMLESCRICLPTSKSSQIDLS